MSVSACLSVSLCCVLSYSSVFLFLDLSLCIVTVSFFLFLFLSLPISLSISLSSASSSVSQSVSSSLSPASPVYLWPTISVCFTGYLFPSLTPYLSEFCLFFCLLWCLFLCWSGSGFVYTTPFSLSLVPISHLVHIFSLCFSLCLPVSHVFPFLSDTLPPHFSVSRAVFLYKCDSLLISVRFILSFLDTLPPSVLSFHLFLSISLISCEGSLSLSPFIPLSLFETLPHSMFSMFLSPLLFLLLPDVSIPLSFSPFFFYPPVLWFISLSASACSSLLICFLLICLLISITTCVSLCLSFSPNCLFLSLFLGLPSLSAYSCLCLTLPIPIPMTIYLSLAICPSLFFL